MNIQNNEYMYMHVHVYNTCTCFPSLSSIVIISHVTFISSRSVVSFSITVPMGTSPVPVTSHVAWNQNRTLQVK